MGKGENHSQHLDEGWLEAGHSGSWQNSAVRALLGRNWEVGRPGSVAMEGGAPVPDKIILCLLKFCGPHGLPEPGSPGAHALGSSCQC